MRRIGWFVLQIAIIAFFIWVDWGVSHSGDPRTIPGLATALGVLIAFGLTFVISEAIDFNKPSLIVRPPPAPPSFDGDVTQAIDEGDKLSASARSVRELPEPLRRLPGR